MTSQKLGVHIAAAGEGSRMREVMADGGYDPHYPKHLLPTGSSHQETLLGRIIRQGLEPPVNVPPTVHASCENAKYMAAHEDVDPRAHILITRPGSPWGPFIRPLLSEEVRILAATGDHYTEGLSWEALLDHHDSHPYPVTVVASPVGRVPKGAVFDVAAGGQITRFHRPAWTAEDQAVNIGLYVFDPTTSVIESLRKVGITHENSRDGIFVSPEAIVNSLIEDGLMGAYVLPAGSAYNINTPDAYHSLLEHTAIQTMASRAA